MQRCERGGRAAGERPPMSTKNKMNIIGYLGADPELRYTNNGRRSPTLRIATTERWTDKAGTAQEHTEWHRVVAWANLAEASAKYLKRGSLVSVEGPIRSRKFTDKEGVERYAFEVIASEVLSWTAPSGRSTRMRRRRSVGRTTRSEPRVGEGPRQRGPSAR